MPSAFEFDKCGDTEKSPNVVLDVFRVFNEKSRIFISLSYKLRLEKTPNDPNIFESTFSSGLVLNTMNFCLIEFCS